MGGFTLPKKTWGTQERDYIIIYQAVMRIDKGERENKMDIIERVSDFLKKKKKKVRKS